MATAKTPSQPATPVVRAPAKTLSKSAPAKPRTAKTSGSEKVVTTKAVTAKPAPKKVQPTITKTVVKTAAKKPKKAKLIRDSFTIPKFEYLVLDSLKLRAAKLGRLVKKSELLRAGIKAVAALTDAAFLSSLEKVPVIKTGRPTTAK